MQNWMIILFHLHEKNSMIVLELDQTLDKLCFQKAMETWSLGSTFQPQLGFSITKTEPSYRPSIYFYSSFLSLKVLIELFIFIHIVKFIDKYWTKIMSPSFFMCYLTVLLLFLLLSLLFIILRKIIVQS